MTPVSSPLDCFLAVYRHTSAQDFFGGLGDFDKRSQPDVAQLISLLSFASWQIRHYLRTTRVSREILQAVFDTVPHTPGTIPTKPQWLQICIALTPPFRTKEPHRVLDIRPEDKRYGGTGWYQCDVRKNLIAMLGEAGLTYETRVQVWDTNVKIEEHQTQIDILTNEIDRLKFLMLRDQGRLPAELNRLPTKTVNEAITTSNKLKRSFQRYGDPQILRREYQQARHTWYEELLRNMETAFVQAFKNNDPAHRYPKGAIHAAISSILTPLLYYELRPRSNSTTPGAIQRRLSNRKIV